MSDYERTTTQQSTTVDPVNSPRSATSTTERTYVPPGPGAAAVAARFVMFLFGVLQVALILRIILLLLVANTGNDVVSLILSITDPFVEPFRGMFSFDRVTADSGSKFDVAALVALIGWTLVEALLLAALRIFARRPADAI